VGGLGSRFFDCVNHRLRVRWLGHRLGQFIDPIAQVRAVLPKLLEQRDHLGDLLLTQDRQLQIKEFPALGKAIVSSLRREDQDDQIKGRQRRCARQPCKGGGSSARWAPTGALAPSAVDRSVSVVVVVMIGVIGVAAMVASVIGHGISDYPSHDRADRAADNSPGDRAPD
jgi:hypothetical protein